MANLATLWLIENECATMANERLFIFPAQANRPGGPGHLRVQTFYAKSFEFVPFYCSTYGLREAETDKTRDHRFSDLHAKQCTPSYMPYKVEAGEKEFLACII